MEVEWKQVATVELKWNQGGSKVEASGYNGTTMEVKWKQSGSKCLEWKYLGIRMELEWK